MASEGHSSSSRKVTSIVSLTRSPGTKIPLAEKETAMVVSQNQPSNQSQDRPHSQRYPLGKIGDGVLYDRPRSQLQRGLQSYLPSFLSSIVPSQIQDVRVLTFRLPHGSVGEQLVVPTRERDREIFFAERTALPPGRKSRFVRHQEPIETDLATLVIMRCRNADGDSRFVLLSGYFGPAVPREPNDPSLPQRLHQESLEFWRSHAFLAERVTHRRASIQGRPVW